MKQRLLFGLMILFSMSIHAQGFGVPPCGLNIVNACDNNGDGFEIFDLTNVLPFSSLSCLSLNEDDFGSVIYYETEDDMNNQTNPIVNPTAYVNISNPQRVYYRANAIDVSSGFISNSNNLEVLSFPNINQPTNFEICDDNQDGIGVYDLSLKTNEVIGELTNVSISYHSTENDGLSGVNALPNIYTNVNNPETIYVRVENNLTGCASIVNLDLIVKDCSDSGVIEINAFYDADTNGAFDANENLFTNGVFTYEANNDGVQHVVSSSTGSFSIISDDDNNIYDISYSLYNDYDDCYDVTTATYEDVSVTNGENIIYNFPITKENECSDVGVYLTSYAPPRPGFDYKNQLVIINKGLETITSGSIEFIHDSSVTFNNVSYVDVGNSIINTSTGFILNFNNLEPNQSESVVISMNVPVPIPLGVLLTNTVTYSAVDLSAANNSSTLTETVIGSYDPNDITESHGPEILHSEFSSSDYLYYTVRFQNVGTADAINVSIDNTLDARLDKSTIQMLASSHANVFTRIDNQLNWQFDNIHLPSEDMDESNSHGYVYYKIKPTEGYSIGDIIPNTAEIYFDFNTAVITNTFETKFITVLSINKFSRTEFSIFPNPAKNTVTLKFNKSISNIINTNIYNIQGKLVFNSKNNIESNNSTQLNVSFLKSGMYFLNIDDGVSKTTQKLIIE